MASMTLISDLHAGDRRFQYEYLVGMFTHVGKSDDLVIIGDVLDSWVAKAWDTKRLNDLFHTFADNIVIIQGNHDPANLGEHFPHCKIAEECTVDVAGRPFAVFHGHQFDNVILQHYRLSRYAAKLNQWVMKVTGWDLRILRQFSLASRKRNDYYRTVISHTIREIKAKYFPSYAGVFCGHTHYPVSLKHPDGFIYVNTGDIVDSFSYAKVADGKIDLLGYFPTWLD